MASYLPPIAEPFSCFGGEEDPGLGPPYGDELLLLLDTSLLWRDRDRGRDASDAAAVSESLSRSAVRSTAEGGRGNASGKPVM